MAWERRGPLGSQGLANLCVVRSWQLSQEAALPPPWIFARGGGSPCGAPGRNSPPQKKTLNKYVQLFITENLIRHLLFMQFCVNGAATRFISHVLISIDC